MGTTDTNRSKHAAPVSCGRSPRFSPGGGLVIIGPTEAPVAGLDGLFECPGLEPIEAMADRLASWITVTDELIEVTRDASRAIRSGSTPVVFLDAHRGDAEPVPVESREFVCVRLGQIMIGLAEVPSFVVLYCERLARAFILDSLGDDQVETVATTSSGYPVWELTNRTMFPGVRVAACPGDRPIGAVAEMVHWFEKSDRR